MKKIIISAFLLSMVLTVYSQAPVVVWDKTYGGSNHDEAFYAAQASDGSIIVCGYTMSEGQGGKDIRVMKLNEKGEMIWDNTYGGAGDDIAYHFTFGKNGEIILAGTTDSWGKGGLDFLIMAIDKRGRQLWKQTYGGSGDDVLKRIFPLTDSTWLSFGETDSWGGGKTDIFMMKTDTTSKHLRRKTLGGKKAELFGDVYVMPDTTFVIIGSTRSYSNGAFDAWFYRVDQNGRSKGRKNYGKQRFEYGYGILPTPDGGFIIAGATNTETKGFFDGWALKINKDLFEEFDQWPVHLGDKKDEHFRAILPNKKSYMLVGNTQSYGESGWNLWMVGLGHRGEILWSETFGHAGDDYINSIIVLESGGFLACGYTTSDSSGGKDFWIVRLK